MLSRRLFLLLIVILLLSLPLSAQHIELMSRDTLEWDGLERTYEIYMPESMADADDIPMIVALHDFVGNARTFATMTDLNSLGDEMGALVLYPEVVDYGWNIGLSEAGFGFREPIDDMGFLLALLDEMVESHNVDAERIYLTGYARGGLFAYHLACQVPERFASVVIVSALMFDYYPSQCGDDVSAPVDMLIVGGSDDQFFPYGGRRVTIREPHLDTMTMPDTMRFWGDTQWL